MLSPRPIAEQFTPSGTGQQERVILCLTHTQSLLAAPLYSGRHVRQDFPFFPTHFLAPNTLQTQHQGFFWPTVDSLPHHVLHTSSSSCQTGDGGGRLTDSAVNNLPTATTHMFPRRYTSSIHIYFNVQMDDPNHAASYREDMDHFCKGMFVQIKSHAYRDAILGYNSRFSQTAGAKRWRRSCAPV